MQILLHKDLGVHSYQLLSEATKLKTKGPMFPFSSISQKWPIPSSLMRSSLQSRPGSMPQTIMCCHQTSPPCSWRPSHPSKGRHQLASWFRLQQGGEVTASVCGTWCQDECHVRREHDPGGRSYALGSLNLHSSSSYAWVADEGHLAAIIQFREQTSKDKFKLTKTPLINDQVLLTARNYSHYSITPSSERDVPLQQKIICLTKSKNSYSHEQISEWTLNTYFHEERVKKCSRLTRESEWNLQVWRTSYFFCQMCNFL